MTALTVIHPERTSLAEQVQHHQAQARTLAAEHVEQFLAALDQVAETAAQIAAGGDAYPVGARETARQIAEQAPQAALNVRATMGRAS